MKESVFSMDLGLLSLFIISCDILQGFFGQEQEEAENPPQQEAPTALTEAEFHFYNQNTTN